MLFDKLICVSLSLKKINKITENQNLKRFHLTPIEVVLKSRTTRFISLQEILAKHKFTRTFTLFNKNSRRCIYFYFN